MATGAEIRRTQEGQIKTFIYSQHWRGQRVLDYGCGHAPYSYIVVSLGGEYNGWNRSEFPPHDAPDVGRDDVLDEFWDVILCTQVIQFIPNPAALLMKFRHSCSRLVLTYATNWPEVEGHDRFRYTKAGMEEMLRGWHISNHRMLGSVPFGDAEQIALGYGVVALPN